MSTNSFAVISLTYFDYWVSSFDTEDLEPFWQYLPNLLETWLLPRFFVSKVRDFKFWLLAYFLFPLTVRSFSKIWQHWYKTFYKGPPFDVFWFCNLPKIHRGDPYKMSNINVVQSFWNFAQSNKTKNKQVAKIWSL